MTQNILLEAKQVTREYQESNVITNVLRGVNFSVCENEMIAIIGSSGSGKSTLLHILGTLDNPTSGQVLFRGNDLFKLSANRLSVFRNTNLGFVYQFHHLLTDFTALENVCIPQLIGGASRSVAVSKATALLERVGLGHRLNHKPSELSGGERQRVAIARAIVNRPALILADEPTGNLDHSSAVDIFDLLSDLRKETGCSLVVVTHDRELTRKFERQVIMRDGVITE
jgi:lipoprotein-releasing system ATP-binding protein